jgi:site-specific recombinase XerC
MRRMHHILGRAARKAWVVHAEDLVQLLMATDESLPGLRDRAIFLLGYDTLYRRGELVSVMVEDHGPLKVLLRRSKTDPHSAGCRLQFSPRTDAALQDWLSASGITLEPIFWCIAPSGKLTQGFSTS